MTVAERVQNGADRISDAYAELGFDRTGWMNLIDLDELSVASPWRCVLGQLGDFELCPDLVGGYKRGIDFGFRCTDDLGQDEYPELTRVWREFIYASRN